MLKRFLIGLLIIAAIVAASAAQSITPAFAGGGGDTAVTIKAQLQGNQHLACQTFCSKPESGDRTVASIAIPSQFAQIDALAITLRFTGNLLDPGEQISVLSGQGFSLADSANHAVRTVTINVGADHASRFIGASTAGFAVWAGHGDVKLTGVVVTITGIQTCSGSCG